MVQDAIDMMEKYGIDQLPVITEAGKNVGHINDLVAMQIVFERKHPESTSISSVMGRPYPQVDIASEIDSVYKQFKLGTSMVILTKEGKANGVLTKFDIVQHLRSSAGAEHVKSDKKEKATKVTA
jgi:predicted transcriptional regulator